MSESLSENSNNAPSNNTNWESFRVLPEGFSDFSNGMLNVGRVEGDNDSVERTTSNNGQRIVPDQSASNTEHIRDQHIALSDEAEQYLQDEYRTIDDTLNHRLMHRRITEEQAEKARKEAREKAIRMTYEALDAADEQDSQPSSVEQEPAQPDTPSSVEQEPAQPGASTDAPDSEPAQSGTPSSVEQEPAQPGASTDAPDSEPAQSGTPSSVEQEPAQPGASNDAPDSEPAQPEVISEREKTFLNGVREILNAAFSKISELVKEHTEIAYKELIEGNEYWLQQPKAEQAATQSKATQEPQPVEGEQQPEQQGESNSAQQPESNERPSEKIIKREAAFTAKEFRDIIEKELSEDGELSEDDKKVENVVTVEDIEILADNDPSPSDERKQQIKDWYDRINGSVQGKDHAKDRAIHQYLEKNPQKALALRAAVPSLGNL